jgi:hypothetical protein
MFAKSYEVDAGPEAVVVLKSLPEMLPEVVREREHVA